MTVFMYHSRTIVLYRYCRLTPPPYLQHYNGDVEPTVI